VGGRTTIALDSSRFIAMNIWWRGPCSLGCRAPPAASHNQPSKLMLRAWAAGLCWCSRFAIAYVALPVH
jgi:hypothetical protein